MNYRWRLGRFGALCSTVRIALFVGFALVLAGGLASAKAPAEQAQAAKADPPRVLATGKLPDDHRLGPLQNFEGYFPFTPASPEAWQQRANRVRRRCSWPPACGRCRRRLLTMPSCMVSSTATTTPSRKSTWKAFRAISSRAISIGRRESRAGCPACSVLMATGTGAGSTTAAENIRASRLPKGPSVRNRRPLPAASPLRAVGSNGLRRLSLRHGGLRR